VPGDNPVMTVDRPVPEAFLIKVPAPEYIAYPPIPTLSVAAVQVKFCVVVAAVVISYSIATLLGAVESTAAMVLGVTVLLNAAEILPAASSALILYE